MQEVERYSRVEGRSKLETSFPWSVRLPMFDQGVYQKEKRPILIVLVEPRPPKASHTEEIVPVDKPPLLPPKMTRGHVTHASSN